MPTTLILGGNGKTAKHITRLLTRETSPPHTVYSLIRNPAQADALRTELGATPIVQSLEDATVADLAATMRTCAPDCVVWAAGAGYGEPERADRVDREAAIKAMDAAAAAAVGRYVVVSALDVRDREGRGVPGWYDEGDVRMSGLVWGNVEPYMRAKFAADVELRTGNEKRGLRYTIVRPGGLGPDDSKSTVEAGKVHIVTYISREDVARVVVHCIQDEGTVGLAFDVVGGSTPIPEAIKGVVDNNLDCFEGYY